MSNSNKGKNELQKACIDLLKSKDSDGVTYAERIAWAMVKEAIAGNVRAFVAIRDTVYSKPVTAIEITGSPQVHVSMLTNYLLTGEKQVMK